MAKTPAIEVAHDHPLTKLLKQMGGKDLASEFAVHMLGTLPGITGGDGCDDYLEQANHALALITAVDPQNRLEGLLAAQMAGIHSLMMQTTKRAYRAEYVESADTYVGQAVKLSRLYLEQIAALDKMRGKGQQKIVVERVNVEAGGQAAIGVVEGVGVNHENPGQSPCTAAKE